MRIFEYNGVVLRWFNRVYMFKAQVIKMFIGLSMILKSRPAKCGKATILTTFFWPDCLNFKNWNFVEGFPYSRLMHVRGSMSSATVRPSMAPRYMSRQTMHSVEYTYLPVISVALSQA